MLTLAENVIVAGADNCPPMLDKTQYSSWASRMLLYIKGKEHGKLLVDSFLYGPFKYGTFTVPGTKTTPATVRDRTYDELTDDKKIRETCDIKSTNTVLYGPFKYGTVTVPGTKTTPATVRDRTYDELTDAKKIRETCNIKATNIVLQGLPQDIYNMVNHHKEAKDIWDRVKLLIEVTVPRTKTTPATVRDRTYDELTDAKKICETCNIKATNIVLQGLPQDIYNMVNHHKEAKDIWDRVKLLIEGSEISLQERESKLYDKFDTFTLVSGETIHLYYLRFTQLINDMHSIGMTM
ncbi:hypothetical protein Tco_0490045 [Tanacetum coccineum]